MTGGQGSGVVAVEVRGLTKSYGGQRVVDDLSFEVHAGGVTGFLGPNGAGKTTTLRVLLGLAAPTAGQALVLGRRFEDLDDPTRALGALLDSGGVHPGMRVRHELEIQAAAGAVEPGRVDVVLDEVGLSEAADKRVGALSLGMRQRLGLAAALLGEPALLVLDEPANGLDPAGMHWLRNLLRAYATRGGAVLVSSHVLSELALFADEVVVISRGRLVADAPVAELVSRGAERVFVASPDPRLPGLLTELGGALTGVTDGLLVAGLSAARIGDAAASAAIPLHQLRSEAPTLEDVFLQLTADGGDPR
jgi:ABC-2 type transport system ATP-binding protein